MPVLQMPKDPPYSGECAFEGKSGRVPADFCKAMSSSRIFSEKCAGCSSPYRNNRCTGPQRTTIASEQDLAERWVRAHPVREERETKGDERLPDPVLEAKLTMNAKLPINRRRRGNQTLSTAEFLRLADQAKALIQTHGTLSAHRVAILLHVTHERARTALRLASLNGSVRSALIAGDISVTLASNMASYPTSFQPYLCTWVKTGLINGYFIDLQSRKHSESLRVRFERKVEWPPELDEGGYPREAG